ncbi:MAG: TIGR04086 family membrane protein [Ruminococcaceae bacterium]|nr:TIGR04086 family membrane protein [Oscillospiraceae bacterium]
MKKHVTAHSVPRNTPKDTVDDSILSWISSLLKALVIALAVGLFLLTFTAAALCFTSNPDRLIRPTALIIAAVSAVAGGFAIGKIRRHAALFCGLLEGSLLTLVFLLGSLFFKSESSGYSTVISCLLHIGFLLCTVLGAMLGIRPPKRKRRR